MRRALLGLGTVLAATACVKSGTAKPVAPALAEALREPPGVVYAAALKAVTDEGLPLRYADAATGLIETDYSDVAGFSPLAASQYPTAERLVRYRVLATPDPAGTGTKFAIFAMYSPFRRDYGMTERDERAIPGDHPGMEVVRKIAERTKKAVGGG